MSSQNASNGGGATLTTIHQRCGDFIIEIEPYYHYYPSSINNDTATNNVNSNSTSTALMSTTSLLNSSAHHSNSISTPRQSTTSRSSISTYYNSSPDSTSNSPPSYSHSSPLASITEGQSLSLITTKKIKDLEDHISYQSDNLRSVIWERDNLKHLNFSLESQLQQLISKLSKQSTQIDSLLKENQVLKNNLKDRKQLQLLLTSTEKENVELRDNHQQFEDLRQKLSNIEKERNDLQDEDLRLRHQNDNLAADMGRLQDELNYFIKTRDNLLKENLNINSSYHLLENSSQRNSQEIIDLRESWFNENDKDGSQRRIQSHGQFDISTTSEQSLLSEFIASSGEEIDDGDNNESEWDRNSVNSGIANTKNHDRKIIQSREISQNTREGMLEKEIQLKQMHVELNTIREDRDELKCNFDKISDENNTLLKRFENLRAETMSKDEELKSVIKNRNELQEELTRVTKNHDVLQVELQSITNDRDNLREKLKTISNALDELNGKYNLEKNILEENIEKLQEELNDVISRHDKLSLDVSSERSSLESKIHQLQVDLDSSRQDLEESRKELKLSQELFKSLEQEYNFTRKELDNSRQELETSRQEFDTKCQDLESSQQGLATTRQELDFIRKELDLSRSELVSVKQELNSIQEVFVSTQQELNSTKNDLNSLQNIREKYTILKSQYTEIIEQNHDFTIELEKSQTTSNEFKQQNEQYITQLDTLQQEKENIIRSKNVTEIENDLLKSQLENLQASSLSKLSDVEKEYRIIRQQRDELILENSKIQSESGKLKVRINTLVNENEEILDLLQKVKQEQDDDLKKERREMINKIKLLTQDLSAVKEQREELKAQNARISLSMTKVSEESERGLGVREDLKNQLNNLKDQYNLLLDENEIMKKERIEAEKLQVELSTVKRQLKNKTNNNISVKESARSSVSQSPPPPQRKSVRRASSVIQNQASGQHQSDQVSNRGSQDSIQIRQESASIAQAKLVKVDQHRPQPPHQTVRKGVSQSQQISHISPSLKRSISSQQRHSTFPEETIISINNNGRITQLPVINKTSKRISSIYSSNEESNEDSGVYLPRIISPAPTKAIPYLITSNKGMNNKDQHISEEPTQVVDSRHNSLSGESTYNDNTASRRSSLYNSPPSPSFIPKLVDINKRSSSYDTSSKPLPSVPSVPKKVNEKRSKSDDSVSGASTIKNRRSLILSKSMSITGNSAKKISGMISREKDKKDNESFTSKEAPLCEFCNQQPCKKKAIKGYRKYCSNKCKESAVAANRVTSDNASEISKHDRPRKSYSSSIYNASTESLPKRR
ncbi:15182_t:CDS:2 [Funneliformis geosporum]|uniref:18425_t:CDS:1 n=1 Tax=Funneliformis geosporum TaxID=1117311 RepID=A0A9W4SVG6_9GLOM|nr:15182_t:CDS:2 [Funneliformis geosporum]CAI2182963.1 18425_t:CDS:2 [Funneliformis geosporum]